jgi:acyl dehydratase
MDPRDHAQIATRGLVGQTFEQFEVGQEYWTPGRTITETDFVNFAAFTGDWNPHHVDATFAAATGFGQRLAHGALVLSVVTGLVVRLRVFESTIVALLEWRWQYLRPTLIGTRLQARVRVAEKKETRNRAHGVIIFGIDAIDQEDQEIATSRWHVLILRSAEHPDG